MSHKNFINKSRSGFEVSSFKFYIWQGIRTRAHKLFLKSIENVKWFLQNATYHEGQPSSCACVYPRFAITFSFRATSAARSAPALPRTCSWCLNLIIKSTLIPRVKMWSSIKQKDEMRDKTTDYKLACISGFRVLYVIYLQAVFRFRILWLMTQWSWP